MKHQKKGPNLAKWKDYRLELLRRAQENENSEEKEQLTEHFLGVHTMKSINRNAQDNQEMAKKSIVQMENDVKEIYKFLKIAKEGLNEGKVPDSKTGHGIMQLAANIGALAGQMWK